MSAVNVPLLRKTLEHIEAHPEEWRQGEWVCGTAGCFAWHAAVLDGADSDPDSSSGEFVTGPSAPESEHVSNYAETALGLSEEQARQLFDGFNTLDDLRRIVADLAAS